MKKWQQLIVFMSSPIAPEKSRVTLLSIRGSELHINLVRGPNEVEYLLDDSVLVILRVNSSSLAFQSLDPVRHHTGVRGSLR